jgi:hypothetical protein
MYANISYWDSSRVCNLAIVFRHVSRVTDNSWRAAVISSFGIRLLLGHQPKFGFCPFAFTLDLAHGYQSSEFPMDDGRAQPVRVRLSKQVAPQHPTRPVSLQETENLVGGAGREPVIAHLFVWHVIPFSENVIGQSSVGSSVVLASKNFREDGFSLNWRLPAMRERFSQV